MKVNSANTYRSWCKAKRGRIDVNENYIGCTCSLGDQLVNGFYNLFHGIKDDISKHLPSLLDIAEDNQAIYEFLQNAVDCGATHFWAFYNDKYFLAVNNGSKFNLDGVTALLNIAQSPKDTASSIGRLGIGFKLVHRLVGKGNGTKELIAENKGPVMFSWDSHEQLNSLMSSETIEYVGLDENPFLFKIAITNFPTNGGEVVKDINYKDALIFPESELVELREYVSLCLREMYSSDSASFNQGSLFFIKLGENKKQLLDDDLSTLKTGIEYSMNTLKQLSHICFNGEEIVKNQLVVKDSSISKESEQFKQIEPQYENYDILYSFGYLPLDFTSKDYIESLNKLKQSPNFYKYFPMGDETDNMALFIHCDSFQIEANRRRLSNHHTNRALLPVIANSITSTLEQYKNDDRERFLQLYASILLSDKPVSQEKSWMNSTLYDILYSSLKTAIPTTGGYSSEIGNIKVKKVKMPIPLDKIGLERIKWFNWFGENHKDIISAAVDSNKLGIKEWNINDVIENANITLLNTWLDKCSEEDFNAFLAEIKSITTSKKVEGLLPQIKTFKVGTERKSRQEIIQDSTYIITSAKTFPIIDILEKAGLKCTDVTIESHPLTGLLAKQNEKNQYQNIKAKLEKETTWNKLTADDKLKLISTLSSFEDIGDATIKSLKIFKSLSGTQCALEELTRYKVNSQDWEKPYVICKDEDYTELTKYLVPAEKFFSDIVEKHFTKIIASGVTLTRLYEIYKENNQVWKDDFSIKIIQTYSAVEDVLGLLEITSSKAAVDEFVKHLKMMKLDSKVSYAPTSFEYRCIKLAAKEEATSIRNKIAIDETPLYNFTTSDELTFKCTPKDHTSPSVYTMKLSEILPGDTQIAIYGKVVNNFSSITNYRKIFSANSDENSAVQTKLKKILNEPNRIITPAQFIFILFTRWQSNYTSFSYWQNLIRLAPDNAGLGKAIASILSYAYDNNLTDVLIENQSVYKATWNYSIAKRYLFSKDYTVDSERGLVEIEEWCQDDSAKKEFLKKLDACFDDHAEIKRRKLFKANNLAEWEGDTFPHPFIKWVSTLGPIVGDKQQHLLLSLISKFNNNQTLNITYAEDDFCDVVELDSSKYYAWKQKGTISIYRLHTEMPCRIVYDKTQILFKTQIGAFHYFPTTKRLYIKGVKEEEVATTLAQVYPNSSIPFDYKDYTDILFDSYDEQRKKDEEIKNLRSQLDQIRGDVELEEEKSSYKDKERAEYEQRISDFLGGSFNLEIYNLHSEHIISCYRILNYLRCLGYEFADDFDEKAFVSSGEYTRIKLQNGTYVNTSGAKFGIWYIHPNIWRDIQENDNWACVCTGNNESDFVMVKSIADLEQLAKRSKNTLIKLQSSDEHSIMNVIDTVFPGSGNNSMKIHMMLKIHDTPNEEINSLFENAFNMDADNFKLD